MKMLSSKKKRTVSLVTFGCAKNLVDSEVMLGYLRRAGYVFMRKPEKADVVILNTCGFIKPAKDEAIQAVDEAAALKRKNKKKTVVVTGCYVERYKQDLRSKYPEIDVWLGVKDFDKIVQAIEGKFFRSGNETFLCSHTTPRLLSTPPSWAYLKISEGCSHECAFCAIPLIKGPYQSRSISSIVEEAQELGRRGVREINLISQDTTYFGRDKGVKEDLVKLLRRLIDVPRIRWIRLLYGYPEEITDALLELMREEKICSYLDIPFQHADRRILKEMKRSMDGKRAITLIDKIRKRLPDVALRTSLIVGFPGEGRREFESLKTFIQAVRFDHLGVFAYSPEEGTDSFQTGDPIPDSEKLRRQEDIMQIQAEISSAINKKYLNQRLEVLMEYPSEAAGKPLFGRARFQAPEVDGVIYIRDDRRASRRIKPLESIPNSVIIKQFSEVGPVTARPRPTIPETLSGFSAPLDCSRGVGGINTIKSKFSRVSPLSLAAGVAGTGAAPPIEVCSHRGIWDAYKPIEKVEIVGTDVYDLHGKIVR